MKIAILHYHLEPGGVSAVIQSHIRSLIAATEGEADQLEIVLIHGPGTGGLEADFTADLPSRVTLALRELQSLGYQQFATDADGARLTAEIESVLQEAGFTPTTACLHWHNHSLGKNPAVPDSVTRLARNEWPTLLQQHDFAEDFRPQNMDVLRRFVASHTPSDLSKFLYPQAPHIHFAALTGRDLTALGQLGIPEERLHYVPNPVPPTTPVDLEARSRIRKTLGIEPDRLLALYPVRGIRRKNLGELLLYSVLRPDIQFAVTLPATSVAERTAYEHWKTFADNSEIPVWFEIGTQPLGSFDDIVSAGDVLVTTSIAEGFGLVFLESWVRGRPLVGRDIPEITKEFKAAGMRFPQLTQHFNIPASPDEVQQLATRFAEGFRQLIPEEFHSLTPDIDPSLVAGDMPNTIDFARLTSPQQREIIGRVQGDRAFRDEVLGLNPTLASLNAKTRDDESLESNRRIVENRYNQHTIGTQLLDIYQRLLKETPTGGLRPPPSPNALLAYKLDPRFYYPIRTETE